MADHLDSGAVAVVSMTAGYLRCRAVNVRNSLRTGAGLALAVALTFAVPLDNGFWVVLATMSVLRSSALTTGNSVLRAITGTLIGVVIGAAVIGALGVNPVVMWLLLPLVSFASSYVPEIGSFAAGQAAFTMLVLIVFNLVRPTGWQLGLIRLEDVAVGAGVAVLVSAFLWPRGATAWVESMIGRACLTGARYLRAAVSLVIGDGPGQEAEQIRSLRRETVWALRTLDDAVRHYLFESGGSTDSGTPVVAAANRAWRLRTTADLIADLVPPPAGDYRQAREVLQTHTTAICARLDGTDAASAIAPISDEFVPALRAGADAARTSGADAARTSGADGAGDSRITTALPLLTVAAHIGELELTYSAPQIADC